MEENEDKIGSYNDVSSYLQTAKNQLEQGQNEGVSPQEWDDLKKHQGINMYTSLFLNLIGAANNIKDPSQYGAPIQQRVKEEKEALLEKDRRAQQKMKNASEFQNFGTNQFKIGQQLEGAEHLKSRPSPFQMDVLEAARKLAKIRKEQEGDIDTLQQYKEIYPNVLDLAKLQSGNDISTMKAELQHDKGFKPYIRNQPGTNIPLLIDPMTGKSTVVDYGQQINGSEGIPSFKLRDLSTSKATQYLTPSQIEAASKKIPKMVDQYKKDYGMASNNFEKQIDSLDSTLNLAMKGNYVAANSLPARMARLFEDLGSGRLTNFDIQMQKDPTGMGVINNINSKVRGIEGIGKITPLEARYIREQIQALKKVHEKYNNLRKAELQNRIDSVIGVHFDDPEAIFGTANFNTPQKTFFREEG